jgi:hypothetical protein
MPGGRVVKRHLRPLPLLPREDVEAPAERGQAPLSPVSLDAAHLRDLVDRAIREATTILDARLQIDVVGKVLSPDLNKATIKVSTAAAEQEGMFNICRGLTPAFRGPLHHTLKDHMPRPEALKFCGFVDTLLGVFTEATKGKA